MWMIAKDISRCQRKQSELWFMKTSNTSCTWCGEGKSYLNECMEIDWSAQSSCLTRLKTQNIECFGFSQMKRTLMRTKRWTREITGYANPFNVPTAMHIKFPETDMMFGVMSSEEHHASPTFFHNLMLLVSKKLLKLRQSTQWKLFQKDCTSS